MSNGRALSGSGSNQSQPKIFPPGTVSSDSRPALTVKNVKRLEKEYATSGESFNKKRIRDYIKQSNLALSGEERSGETSTELFRDEEPEGASSSLPAKERENDKEVCQQTSAVISRKDKLSAALATNSPSARPTGSKPKDSNGSGRRRDVEDMTTQTEWSYSDESLATSEDGEEEAADRAHGQETAQGIVQTEANGVAMLFSDAEVLSKAEESEEPAESKGPAESERPAESKEEARAEEGEENSQTEQCQQAECEPEELAHESPRPESEEKPLSNGEEQKDSGMADVLEAAEEPAVIEEPAVCTFCGAPEKPFPTAADLKKQRQEKLFCCMNYRKVFNTVVEDLVSEDEAEEEMDSAPHADDLQADVRSSIKEKLLQQLDEGGFKNYRQILEQYLKSVFPNRISFRLSRPNDYTIRPRKNPARKHQSTSVPPEDLLEIDMDFVAEHLKTEAVRFSIQQQCSSCSYPSGNVAILIAFTEEARFTYIILEDSRDPWIRAAFGSHGHGVSFHPNGHAETTVNPRTGVCFDQAGAQQKHWNWHDLRHHIHSPPFQPITTKLNSYLTLKIVAQDQIYLWFRSHSNCIHFNVGAQLKLKDPKTSDLLKGLDREEELFLQSKKIQIRSLLSRIETVLR